MDFGLVSFPCLSIEMLGEKYKVVFKTLKKISLYICTLSCVYRSQDFMYLSEK